MPQFTVDAHRPVGAFDVLGVSFATETGLHQPADRRSTWPASRFFSCRTDRGITLVVIAGGHAAFNPEPMADFLDAVVLGDGEQAVLAVTDLIRDWKRTGQPGGRDGLLLAARDRSLYVPRFYDVTYHPDGRIGAGNAEPSGCPGLGFASTR